MTQTHCIRVTWSNGGLKLDENPEFFKEGGTYLITPVSRDLDGVSNQTRDAVYRRSGHTCEAPKCREQATDLHHAYPRGTYKACNRHSAWNLAHLCRCHHDSIDTRAGLKSYFMNKARQRLGRDPLAAASGQKGIKPLRPQQARNEQAYGACAVCKQPFTARSKKSALVVKGIYIHKNCNTLENLKKLNLLEPENVV